MDRIGRFRAGLSYEEFVQDEKTVHAVVRNLEIIGEAVKKIPPHVRGPNTTELNWDRLAELRNVIAHEYFAVDLEIVWDVIETKLPPLRETVKAKTRP